MSTTVDTATRLYPDIVSSDDGVIETSTIGLSEYRQLVGSDPGGSLGVPYLRVPGQPSSATNRYLFLLAYIKVPENDRIAIVDLRQRVDIGLNVGNADTAPRPMIMPVTTDDWSFVDGNISWHLTRVAPDELYPYVKGPNDADCFRFRVTEAPGLLYATATLANPFYMNLTAYTPPNGGQPYGRPLTNDLMTFYDLRFPRNFQQRSVGPRMREIVVDGQCGVALWASVKQTNPGTRAPILTQGTNYFTGLPPEEAFLQNYAANTAYWGVGGSILWRRIGPSRGSLGGAYGGG